MINEIFEDVKKYKKFIIMFLLQIDMKTVDQ